MDVRKRFSVALICSFWLAHSQLLLAGLDQSLDAACRIRCADGSTGSGCAFAVAEGKVWVLTAAHVVESANQVACEFWHEGHISQPLAGQVAGRDTAYDVATVVVPIQAFQGVLPKTVPMAPPDFVVRPGATVTSAGCAHGAWATGVKGHALGYSGLNLHFAPPPADGRSGSAIFDRDGRYIVGVVSARTTSGEIHGIASSIQAVYAAFGRPEQRSRAFASLGMELPGRLVPVAGASCPGGLCPGGSSQPRWYLLPYRYREQFRNQPAPSPSPSPPPDSGGAWPTLPPETTPSPSPPPSAVSPPEVRVEPQVTIDVTPLAEPLTGLAEAQQTLSDAVAGYLEAEGQRRAEQEAEKKIGAVSAEVGAAAQQALKGDLSEAADTVGESATIWATLAEVLWSVLAPLFGVGAVGFAFGKVIVRAIARSLGPSAYQSAKQAIADLWKDDNDSPDEARAKQRMAEAAAEATVRKLNGGAADVTNGGTAK